MSKFLRLLILCLAISPLSNAQTFTWTGSLPILDFQTTTVPITVSGLPSVIDSTFGLAHICMDITHTYDADLVIKLISPAGDSVTLIQGIGGSGDNFWGTCVGVDGTFFSNSTAPYAGIFRPIGNTASFNNGQNPNGIWQLRISDVAGSDTGSVHHASIVFTFNPPQYSGGSTGNVNGTYVWPGTVCPGGASSCDLLPDMTASAKEIQINHLELPGELRLSNATPNIGYGPLEIYSIDSCFCDHIPVPCNTPCPSGHLEQVIRQRIYQKVPGTDTLTYFDRTAGHMTYHPSHGHLHVDNFANFTLRSATSNPDATTWPIIGTSVKQSYCLINLGTCAGNYGNCVDNAGNVITSLPNQNLGFHTGCGTTQGIYVGNYDVYSISLNDPIILNNVCNGTYYVVSITDPDDDFLESDETNNWVAVPITLTQQNAQPVISASGPTNFCTGDSVVLTANIASNYLWSTGDSTQSIVVHQSGVYTVSTDCGTAVSTSDPVTVTVTSPASSASVSIALTGGSLPACPNTPLTFTASISNGGSNPVFQWKVNGVNVGINSAVLSSSVLQHQDSVSCELLSDLSCLSVPTAVSNTMVMNIGTILCYCMPVYGTTANSGCLDGDVIYRITLNTLDNTTNASCPSGLAGYADFSNSTNPQHTTSLIAGNTYTCTVHAGQFGEGYKIWIDYNDDGIFSASEVLGHTTSIVPGSGVVGVIGGSASIPVTIPCNAIPGNHRMRVRCMYSVSGVNIDPCTFQNNYGEVEDYTITILPPSGCPAPAMLSASAISSSQATLNWTAGCNETQWQIHIALPGSGLPPSVPSHPSVTTKPFTVSGLLPATAYQYYVAASCGAAGNSSWAGPFNFTTLPVCSSVPGNSMAVPIELGQLPCATLPIVYTRTNTIANCFSNSYTGANNQASPDVWYRFTLASAATVEVSTCGSPFDTYIHVLNSSGIQLAFNDDNGPFCAGLSASMSLTLSAGTYYVVSEGYGGNTGAITISFKTTTACPLITTLNINCLIQGYYDQGGLLLPVLNNQGMSPAANVCDSITVELHASAAPYQVIHTCHAALMTNGLVNCTFPPIWGSFYAVIKHRNALETWSAQPIEFYGAPVSYNFISAASKAYGNMQVEVENGYWALYSGELNTDENIDLADGFLLETDLEAFQFGYRAADLNGDGNVDLLDQTIIENNISLFIFSAHP